MRKAGLDYRKMDCEMELRGNEVYCTEHYGDRLPYEYLCLGEDYDPFDENY